MNHNKFTTSTKLLALFFFLVLTACSKNPTPERIKKKLIEGTWKISQLKINSSNSTSTFNKVEFQFSSAGSISVSGEMATSGSWYVSEDEKPAKLFLSFPPTAPQLYPLSDDWIVEEMTKRECTLTRNDSSKDRLVFRRID